MFIRYFDTYFNDLDNKFQKLTEIFNIYNYGYAFEVEVDKSGCTSASKLMTLGRFSHGDISIMPDGKTVYMVDTTTGNRTFTNFKSGHISDFVIHLELCFNSKKEKPKVVL